MTKRQTVDGLRSMLSGMGDPSRDKRASVAYSVPLLSDDQLVNAYRSSWITRKIIDIPAYDACRKWRDWQADAHDITILEATENRLGLKSKVLRCKTLARLWGGAAIYIGTDQDPATPFEPETIGKDGLKYLTVLSRRELMAGELEQDAFDENYSHPRDYKISGQGVEAVVHPSRLVLQIGASHPDPWHMSGVNAGWGDSVLQSTLDAISNADSAAGNIASLIFEANVDVFGVPDLMASLASPEYEKRVLDRFALAAASKGINRALIHDATETFDRKQISFAQLPELLEKFLLVVSGAADIPMTRFLGQSPSGMSATGEGDMKNFHDKIASIQQLEIGPAMHRLDEALICSTFGSRPEDITYDWSPLEQMSEKEIAEIGKQTADTAETLIRTGIYLGEELRQATTTQLVENGVFPGLDKIVAETEASGDFDLGETDTPDDDEPDDNAKETGTAKDATPRTLYVRRQVKNAADILKWAKSQGFKNTLSADDLHVTLAHSTTPIDWLKAGEPWEEEVTVKEGGPRVVEVLGAGAVALLFQSSSLQYRHSDIKRAGASWDFDDYQPHITITYEGDGVNLREIKPYQGKIVLGPEIFEPVDANWTPKTGK